ncbi:MAG: crossover junction endodeoxyribonuclease RuvC [Armatimonadetes bacterium]|nr:crossover junction endodeoxyribonuclease RuvC [Armatimonadota bacterium]
MIILGIDPGLERMGYGVIRKQGSRIEALEYGLIKTPPTLLPDRLRLIEEQLTEVIDRTKPDEVATERLLFAANKTTAMDVAKALGVALLVTSKLGLPWCEYSPPEIKLSVVGTGRAEKSQIQFMVTKLLGLPSPPKPDDVADALAIAITHSFRVVPSIRKSLG